MSLQSSSLVTGLNPPQDDALCRSQLRIFSLNVIYQTCPCRLGAKTNCRSIEIPLILPSSGSISLSSNLSMDNQRSEQEQLTTNMDPLPPRDLAEKKRFFPFLLLPLEVRLKIYALVLPSRTFTIETQYPHNGYYYSETRMVSHSTQTLYSAQPYLRAPPPEAQQKLTTYRLLNANFHLNFPSPSVCPELLRTCAQIRDEAEPVMYGAEAVFDFGVYADAIVPFLKDRSALARRAIRHVKIARQVPVTWNGTDNGDGTQQDVIQDGGEVVDCLWSTTLLFLREQCVDLRSVDLTLWAENGGWIQKILNTTGSMTDAEEAEVDYSDGSAGDEDNNGDALQVVKDGKLWREWEWARALLSVEALRHVKVKGFGFTTDD